MLPDPQSCDATHEHHTVGLVEDRPFNVHRHIEELLDELRTVIVGQERLLERLVVCLFAGGHVLLEGVPGVGKTLTLSTLANIVDGTFSRIQFTPDLLPSDIVGTRIYQATRETFTVEPGPVFANFVLADEINRAPAKVQSALLEVMAERQVTLAGHTMRVPQPFLVMATQNPIESEGVFPLPEAQRDRFMMRVLVELPDAGEERQIVARMGRDTPHARRCMTLDQLAAIKHAAATVTVNEAVSDYAIHLVLATRNPGDYGIAELGEAIRSGASPRATLSLIRGARAMALLRGRTAATCQDVYDIAYDVLNHRITMTYDAIADQLDASTATTTILKTVPAPAGM